MKEKNSKFANGGILAVAAMVLYSLVVFIIAGFGDHSATFWISYIFMMLAIVASGVSLSMLSGRANIPHDWLLAYPFYKHCAIYLVVEFIVSTVLMLMDEMDVAWQLPFVSQLVILVVFAVFIGSCFTAKEIIENVQKTVKANTSFMKNLRVDVDMIVAKMPEGTNPEVKKAFSELAEQIRYSDPVSNDAVSSYEEQLKVMIDKANVYLTCNDADNALECCKNAMLLLMERNQRCKISK